MEPNLQASSSIQVSSRTPRQTTPTRKLPHLISFEDISKLYHFTMDRALDEIVAERHVSFRH